MKSTGQKKSFPSKVKVSMNENGSKNGSRDFEVAKNSALNLFQMIPWAGDGLQKSTRCLSARGNKDTKMIEEPKRKRRMGEHKEDCPHFICSRAWTFVRDVKGFAGNK